MKITCGNCSAKYSIADEKVQGKVFKIRCKKCGESIVIRGDEHFEPEGASGAAAEASGEGEAETRVFDYSGYKGVDDAVWHVAVDGGEQQGPYSTKQLAEYLGTGNIDYETFIWREGFSDWQAVKNVQDVMGYVKQAQAPKAAPAAAPAPAKASGGGLFDAAPAAASGGGLFDAAPAAKATGGGLFDAAPAAKASGGGLFDAAPAKSAGGGLFGGDSPAAIPGDIFSSAGADAPAAAGGGGLFSDSDFSGGGDLFAGGADSGGGGIFASTEAPSAAPRVASPSAAMTGARNENSVLFSLSNLQALASGPGLSPVSSAAPVSSGGGGGGGFKVGEEASGLIDIRAMASSLAAEAHKASDVDDMLSLGGGGFAPTLGAPVLAATPQGGMSMGAKIGIFGGGGLLLIAAVIVGVVLFGSPKQDTSAQDEKIALLMKQLEEMKSSNASPEAIAAAQAQLLKTQQEKAAPSEAAAASAEKSEDSGKSADKDSSSKKKSSSKAKEGGDSQASAASSSSSSSASSATPSTSTVRKPTGSSSALDSLLGAPAKKKPEAAAAPAGESLTRSQVVSGMSAVKPAVERCGAGKTGTFKIRATIDASGRVTDAMDTGDFSGTPAGTCAANAVKRARFPASSKSLTVTYPFKIQ